MKRLALLLFWLALGKIAVVEALQRQALVDAVLSAYEGDARRACAALLLDSDAPAATLHRVRVTTGDRAVPVSLWQVGHSNWAERYRHTTVVIDGGSRASCVYDVHKRSARHAL